MNDKAPFGPDNFKWTERLRRKLNETNYEWWARKLEARKQNNPNLYSDRNLKRKFGLTREWYEQKLKDQNFKCAICEKEETTFDSRANVKRRLSVDHCHKSGKIRDLLCWRCNGTLGKIDEDLDLLKKIENYIIKHKEN